MAQSAAGITAQWNSVTIGEVTDIAVAYGGNGLPSARGDAWALDVGSIEITSISTASVSVSQYGKKSTLSITGDGVTFTAKAICQTLTLGAKVNDIWRYKSTFKIVKE
jgi:hypothetical protein